MLVMSVRYSPNFSFHGQVAECEVQVIDKRLLTKRTFVGMTLEEAFDKFKRDNITYLKS